ncbi:hypothetical protein BDW22DRAFT_1326270 [Trametopsis cervina]|nr:hypothetical protein BDW22DRAFT_1326270 [Trametopsis cervina]
MASTSANPYPYPLHTNPTPHQIFHLPRTATQADVKARYYDLVRIYHPDSPVSRALPSPTAQARFQSITAAYDSLRGKSTNLPEGSQAEQAKKNFHNLNTAMWKARQQRRAELRVGLDDRWKDAAMMSAVVVVSFILLAYLYYPWVNPVI